MQQKNVWDYFGLGKEDFLNLSDSKQTQLTPRFYFENVNNAQQESIDASIGSIINSSNSINLKKVYENGKNRTEMSLSTTKNEEKKLKSVTMWTKNGFFADECCDFSLEKANLPENTFFYVNQGINPTKTVKNAITAISTLLHKSCLWPTTRKISSLTTVKTTKLKYCRQVFRN